jgi:hypothetical protein
MDFKTLLSRIDGRPVVVDENMRYSNLLQFLDSNNIPWRSFTKGVSDEEIIRNLRPGEVVVTADRRFAYNLQERAILIPLDKSHYHQMQRLMNTIGRRGMNGFNDVKTCPICTLDRSTTEFSFWDDAHYLRHARNPYVPISRGPRR